MRAPDPAELAAILDAHDRWERSDGREGSRADLSGMDLGGADLKMANLGGANLRGARLVRANLAGANLASADLRQVDLTGASLRGADLSHTTLDGSQLRQAQLRDAGLADADLTDASGLLTDQLGGTNLAGARLPPALIAFEGLANVAEVSKSSQNLLTTIIVICGYTWLTIASTTDVQLLNNAAPASSRMPILGIDIPLVRFYMAAPLLLFCLNLYFQLGLQRLWEELADLPAVFPDGRTLDKKAYPWLLNVLVRSHLPRLRASRTGLTRWQGRFSTVLAWGLVPLTIALSWARFLPCHDWLATGLHIALLAGAVGSGVAFFRLAEKTLRGSERSPARWREAWADARALCVGVMALVASVAYLVSLGAIEGINPASVYDEVLARKLESRFPAYDVRRWVPPVMGRLGLSTSAMLTDASLSIKPPNWSPANDGLLDAVRGGDLEHRNLKHALGFNAFGVNSYLQEADLRWADLREADLRRADFRRARLRGTNFRFARLRGADFRKADLTQARLKDADVTEARFEEATLSGASLADADLAGADFSDANLSGADLRNARFTPAPGTVPNPKKPSRLIRASLVYADLSGADLSGVDLSGADLRHAILTGTRLDGANLTGANLAGALGLTDSRRPPLPPPTPGRPQAPLAESENVLR